MIEFYVIVLVLLVILAIGDLIVGVSNDAVNFLNSALGSKAFTTKTILIIASIGVIFGAITSSGMIEVARKGIFLPGEFYFDEIMVIFMAVMITDVLLLDFFNTNSMPTSTTVSIVFELLGAAFCMGAIKIYNQGGHYLDILNFINTQKAYQIILGIFLSVLVAFTVGAIIQFLSRLLLSFDTKNKPQYRSIVFGALAITSIFYFLLIKGLKNTAFATYSFFEFILENTILSISLAFISSLIFSWLFITIFKKDIYKFIVLIGTFSLATAFSGNDMVNFIGVPVAAWHSFEIWYQSGKDPSSMLMDFLGKSMETPMLFLLFAGGIMIITLWFSKKARSVTETEINLSSDMSLKERFRSNFISRSVVQLTVVINKSLIKITPRALYKKIDRNFSKPKYVLSKTKTLEKPAFDLVRASVNLMVSGILISFATSLKLPLSTTYVTFMVAMGTSFADRAWGLDSAVYRVSGVLNVVGGWLLTALIAFLTSALVCYLLFFGKFLITVILFLFVAGLLIRNFVFFKKRNKTAEQKDILSRSESISLKGVIEESIHNVTKVLNRVNDIYPANIEGVSKENQSKLKKNKKRVKELNTEIDDLNNHVFYFIKNLEESIQEASRFYIILLNKLQDVANSMKKITKWCYDHTVNKHKKMTYKQVNDLIEVNDSLKQYIDEIKNQASKNNFQQIDTLKDLSNKLIQLIEWKIETQIVRTKNDESSPKNTTLYFNLLLETKELISTTFDVCDLYFKEDKKLLN